MARNLERAFNTIFMQITEFRSQIFYYSALFLLSCLIIYNCYVLLVFQEIWGIIPIIIQSIIIGMIITKHRLAKSTLKIWAIVFLVVGSSLQIIVQLIQDVFDHLTVDLMYYLVAGINLLIGSLMVYFTNTTVVVAEVDK